MITVIIADDHAIFRQGLAALLRTYEHISLIGQAQDGQEAIEKIIRLKPDVAVVDISMPRLSGIDVLKEIRRIGLQTNVILLTMHTDPELAQQALAFGASGYLLKENAFDDLLAAFESILNHQPFVSPGICSNVFRLENTENKSKLSLREKEILNCISKGMTNKEIAETLCISSRTVETHRANIMEKLNLHTTAELVKYVIRKGIEL